MFNKLTHKLKYICTLLSVGMLPVSAENVNLMDGMKIEGGKLVIPGDSGTAQGGTAGLEKFGNEALNIGGLIATIVSGLVATGMFIYAILAVLDLSKSANNPSKRAEAQTALLWRFGAFALLGGLTFFIGVAFSIFR